jgi:hypothetical protein
MMRRRKSQTEIPSSVETPHTGQRAPTRIRQTRCGLPTQVEKENQMKIALEQQNAVEENIGERRVSERVYIVSCVEHTSDALVPLRVFANLDDAIADVPTFPRMENRSLGTFEGDLSSATAGVLSGDLWGTVGEIWAFYEGGLDKPEYIVGGGYFCRTR